MKAFVTNQASITADLPYEIIPGAYIQRADTEQIKRIKSELIRFAGTSSWMKPEYLYEYNPVSTQDGAGLTFQPIDEKDWRYYIVTTPDTGQQQFDLYLASSISETPLELTALSFTTAGGLLAHQALIHKIFSLPATPSIKEVSLNDLEEIRRIYNIYTSISTKGLNGDSFPEIKRAMELFDSLNLLPESSGFLIIGLFSIIELLITHNPKLEDRGDSISHQMQSKIPLLSRRFDRPIDYSLFQSAQGDKKIWSSLYSYRSAIAHGGEADFTSSNLRALENPSKAMLFLRSVVKAMLRHSLLEPHLYRDLRAC